MAGRDILASVKAVADLEEKQAQLKAKYESEQRRIKEENKTLVAMLDKARTHIVMSTAPNIIKALGYSHLLNITLNDVHNNECLLKQLSGKKNFDIVFSDFERVITAAAELLYNREDLRNEICEYIEKSTGLKSTSLNKGSEND